MAESNYTPTVHIPLQYFAEGAAADGAGESKPADGAAAPAAEPAAKTFTQAEVDKIVQDRLAREAKKAPVTQPAAKPAESKPDDTTETMKAQIASMQSAMLASELTSQLLLSGVDATKVERVSNLIDKAECLNEAGLPDKAKIKTAVEALSKEFPELIKKAAEETQEGFKFGADLGTGKLDSKQTDAIAEIFGNKK